jgi:hypothetical protein
MSLNQKQMEESLQSAYAILRLLGQIEGEMAVIGAMPGDINYWANLSENMRQARLNAHMFCVSLQKSAQVEEGK